MVSFSQALFLFAYSYSSILSQSWSLSERCIEPVEEGHSYYLLIAPYIQYTYIAFQVDRGNGFKEITRCYTNGSCSTVNPDYIQFLTMSALTRIYNTTLEIQSVSRSMANWTGVWVDIYGMKHTTQPCNITVYLKPQMHECDQPVFVSSNTAVSVTCRTQRVYPAAKCVLNSQQSINPSVNYTYETLNDSLGDVSMQCTVKWSLQPISQQYIEIIFSITMVQFNVIQTQLDTFSLELYTPSAELGKDCPKYVNVSSKCSCILTQSGSPPGRAVWSSSTGAPLVTVDSPDGSSQLTLPERPSDILSEIEYNCSARSVIGQQKVSVNYRPQYIFFPRSPACDQPVFINSSTVVSITCHAEDVNPSAQCRLITYIDVNPSVIYKYNSPSDKAGEVNFWCTFQWTLKPINQQNFTVILAVKMLQMNTFETQIKNIFLNLSVPSVELKSDCRRQLTASSTCTCALSNPGFPPGHAVWSTPTAAPLLTIERLYGSSQLVLSAKLSDLHATVYYCTGTSAIGQQNDPLVYEPQIIYGPTIVLLDTIVFVEKLTTTITVICKVPTIDLFPGVNIEIDAGSRQLRNLRIIEKGAFYETSVTLVAETIGLLPITCTAMNSQEPNIEAKNKTSVDIPVVSEDIKINILQTNSSCYRTDFRAACLISGTNIKSNLVAYFYVNNEMKDKFYIIDGSVNYTLFYNFKLTSPSILNISCEVLNTNGYSVVRKQYMNVDIEVLCEDKSSSNENTTAIATGITLSILFSVMIIIIFFRRRHIYQKIIRSPKLNKLRERKRQLNHIKSDRLQDTEDDNPVSRKTSISTVMDIEDTVINHSNQPTTGPYSSMNFDPTLAQGVSRKINNLLKPKSGNQDDFPLSRKDSISSAFDISDTVKNPSRLPPSDPYETVNVNQTIVQSDTIKLDEINNASEI